jgi:hypothetical protein
MFQNRNSSGVSRRLGLLALGGAFAALLGVFTGCNNKPSGPLSVPLQFRPAHSEPLTGSLPATDAKVHVEAVKDKRANKEEIGRNVEDETPVPVYAADKTPAEFIREVLSEELQKFGIEMTDAPEAADRIISIDLNKFFVEEGNNYRGEVAAVATVTDKGGRVRWKGPIGGEGKTFGRSLSPTNYNEALSDATRRTVGSLVNNPKFAEAITK